MCDENVTDADDYTTGDGLRMVVPIPILDSNGAGRVGKAHRECLLADAAGHLYQACGCFRPDLTRRQRARLAWERARADHPAA